jgi:hypothetical protein
MSQIENEILLRVRHLSGDQKTEVLNYIRTIKGTHSKTFRRKSAMRQIREALTHQE